MEKYLAECLTWDNLMSQGNEALNKTFEFLCADFMQMRFNLNKIPALGDDVYPGTEGPPTRGSDGKLYGFQSKFCQDSYCYKEIIASCENIVDGTEILVIFTKDHYPKPLTIAQTKTTRPTFDYKKPGKNKEWWDEYKNYLVSEKKFKAIHFFAGNDLLNEIKKYPELCLKYFPNKRFKENIYKTQRNESLVDTIALKSIIDDTKNGFSGDSKLYETDLNIAETIQEQYSYRKLCYSNTNFILDAFDELEASIAIETFDLLKIFPFQDIQEYYNKGVELINDDNDIQEKYEVELTNLVKSKKGIFVNYLSNSSARLDYQINTKVKFIPKI